MLLHVSALFGMSFGISFVMPYFLSALAMTAKLIIKLIDYALCTQALYTNINTMIIDEEENYKLNGINKKKL